MNVLRQLPRSYLGVGLNLRFGVLFFYSSIEIHSLKGKQIELLSCESENGSKTRTICSFENEILFSHLRKQVSCNRELDIFSRKQLF